MNTATLIIGLIFLLAAVVSAYVHVRQRKQRKAVTSSRRIAQAVKDYFDRSSAKVSCQCLHVQGHFLILVESEPLKRFRYSHIVETALVSHVEKTLGLHVARVFWRFPLPVGIPSPFDTADIKPAHREEDSIAAGVLVAKPDSEYHVVEDSWDQFQKALQGDAVTQMALSAEDGKEGQREPASAGGCTHET